MATPDKTARILPFGRPPKSAPEADLQLRLQQAVLKLNRALAAQASAVAGWRGGAADLGARAAELAESAADFQRALEALAAEMERPRDIACLARS